MLNPFKEVNWNPDHSQRRAFARSLIIGFPCMALLFLVIGVLTDRGWNLALALKIGGGGAGVGMLLLLVPAIARPFYVVWHFFACCMGLIVANIMLALVFYVLVAGMGLVMRACGRQAIRKTLDRSATSYWNEVGPPPESARYYRQF